MPDLFRLKGESYEKEIYIFSKYTIPVQISEAASPCRRSASCFHNAVYSVFRTCRKILIFYRKPGFYRSLCRYPFPSFSGKPDLSIFQRSRARSCGSSILSFRCAAPLFCVHSPDDVVLWKDGILSFQTMENQPQPLTALCTPDDARDSKIIPFPTLSERQRISQ